MIELNQNPVDIPIVPTQLIQPFRDVVCAALRRVEKLRPDSMHRKIAYVFSEYGNRLYKLTVVDAKRRSNNTTVAGFASGTIFIYGLQLTEAGKPIKDLVRIMLPKDVSLVTEENLHSLRGAQPEDVMLLAKELLAARTITAKDYYDAFAKVPYTR